MIGRVGLLCTLALGFTAGCGSDGKSSTSSAAGSGGSAGSGATSAGGAGGAAGTAGTAAGATGGFAGAAGAAGAGGFGGGPLPDELPFDLERPDSTTPPTASERAEFTRKLTAFYKQIDYFRWVTWHSHGLHASYDSSMPDYTLWWQDTRAIKAGDTVTFQHYGGADNIMIRTPKVLNQAAMGYLVSGDPLMREIVIGYSKGIVALFQGMAWPGEDPPVETITARAIFTHNHSYTTNDGRNVAVDYDPVKVEKFDWNAHTVPNPGNPFFGDIWIRNMRSKDDVPHMFRTVPVLMRVVEDTDDEEVRAAAQSAVDHLKGFAADIVENDYQIRTQEDGMPYVPVEDLASFTKYDALAPNGECSPKLISALLSTGGGTLDNDCLGGLDNVYEDIATAVNYFNYAIIRYFHLAAIVNTLAYKRNDAAKALLDGLITRVDQMVADDEERLKHSEWDADVASYLLASATSGLPLTGEEATIVQREYSAAVDHYAPWPHWDLWDASVPDGTYEYKPNRNDGSKQHIRPEELAFFFEYCASPWKNSAGVEVVDCAVVLDPARWGE